MNEYVIMSGSSVIGIVRARDTKSAAQKALERLAEEYKKIHNVKIMRVADMLGHGN